MPENASEIQQAELSPQQVIDVLEFARALFGYYYPQPLTPDLVNARLKDSSFTPLAATERSLAEALANPKESETELRSFVENFEIISAPFRRIISYLASQLALTYQYTVQNTDVSDYTSKEFKKQQTKVFDFLDRFDHETQFRNVIKQVLRNEIFACTVRTDGANVILQELPVQYIKITSKWDFGYLCDFDMTYFLRPGTSLDGFDDFFKRAYQNLFNGKNGYQTYNPLIEPLSLRGDSRFSYWVSLPPEVGWVFKFDSSLAVGIPWMSSIMPEFINQNYMRSLQKSLNTATSTKILTGSIPLLKDQTAKLANALALDAKITGQFLNVVKNALSEAVKLGVAPIDNWNSVSFDGDSEMYDTWARTALAMTGMNTALFYTSKLKANAIESQLSHQSDSLIMEQSLYPQFSNFLTYWANRDVKRFKHKFFFKGNAYYLDNQRRFTNAMTLAEKGIFLYQEIANCLGLSPQDFVRMLEENKALKLTDMLTPLVSMYQQANTGGRPQKEDSDLSDAGSETRSNGGNIGRGGKEG